MTGKAPDDEYVAEASKKQMDETLNTIENLWLHDGKPFIGGTNEVSIADLFGACEIEQPSKNRFYIFDQKPVIVRCVNFLFFNFCEQGLPATIPALVDRSWGNG